MFEPKRKEVKRLNKKIAVFCLGLILFFCFAAPVMAASPKKIPAALGTTNVITDETEAKRVENPNGIVHVWGAERTADAVLTIGTGAAAKVFTGGEVLVNLDYIIYPDMTTTMHYHKFVITFPVQTNLPNGGSFEGVNTWSAQMTTTPPYIDLTTFDVHFILQGSGDFEGYTLHFDRDPDKATVSWILIH